MAKSLLQAERINQMAEYIRDKGSASVDELCAEFDISSATARRDIDILAKSNRAVKTHGGALSTENKIGYEVPYIQKILLNSDDKKKLSYIAVRYIRDNDVIFLDAGTTCYEILKRLTEQPKENLTIVTNDIFTGYEVARTGCAELIMTGGTLKSGVFTLEDLTTLEFCRRIHANVTFLSCDAIDPEFGYSDTSVTEAAIKREMVRSSERAYLVFDKSKFAKKSLSLVYPPDEFDIFDGIITNCQEPACLEMFSRKGVPVIRE